MDTATSMFSPAVNCWLLRQTMVPGWKSVLPLLRLCLSSLLHMVVKARTTTRCLHWPEVRGWILTLVDQLHCPREQPPVIREGKVTFYDLMSDTSFQHAPDFMKAQLYLKVKNTHTHKHTHTHTHTHLWHFHRPPHSPSFLLWKFVMFIVTRHKPVFADVYQCSAPPPSLAIYQKYLG